MNHPLIQVQFCHVNTGWTSSTIFFYCFLALSTISENKILLSISESAGSEQIWTTCLYRPINNVNKDKKITSHVNGSWPRSKGTRQCQSFITKSGVGCGKREFLEIMGEEGWLRVVAVGSLAVWCGVAGANGGLSS